MQRESGKPTAPARPTSRHSFTGRGQRAPRREKRFSQASTRRPLISYDQHGRPWFVETEIRSGMPGGPWQPLFQAPWHPQSTYFRVNQENTAEMYIDYPTMRSEKRVALDAYHSRAVKLATKKGWPQPKRGEKYSEEIVEEIGTAPRAIEPIVAAEQENPWIMGWSQRPDLRLADLVKPARRMISVEEEGFDFGEDSYNEAVGEARTARVPREIAQSPEHLAKLAEAFQSEDVGGAEDEEISLAAGEVGQRHRRADYADPLVDVGDDEVDGAFAATDPKQEALLDLEDEIDPDVTGGRKVPMATMPKQAKAEQRRKPTPPAFRKGDRAKPGSKGERRTVAQGAKPVVADLHDDE